MGRVNTLTKDDICQMMKSTPALTEFEFLYRGEAIERDVTSCSFECERRIAKLNMDAKIHKRVQRIVVELGQNVRKHAPDMQPGSFDSVNIDIAVRIVDGGVRVLVGCRTKKVKAEGVRASIEALNALNRDQLKQKKRADLASCDECLSNNGGVGLVYVACLAEQPMLCYVEDLDGEDAMLYVMALPLA